MMVEYEICDECANDYPKSEMIQGPGSEFEERWLCKFCKEAEEEFYRDLMDDYYNEVDGHNDRIRYR